MKGRMVAVVALAGVVFWITRLTATGNPLGCDGSTLALYHFDDGTGAIADNACVSGTDPRDGVLNGSYAWTSGQFAGALQIGSVGSWGNMLASNISYSASFTAQFWISRDPASTNDQIMGKGNFSSGVGEWSLGLSSGRVEAHVYAPSGADTIIITPESLTADTWYHVALTYDGSFQKLWVNGVVVAAATNTAGLRQGGETVRVGTDSGTGLVAKIDELRISSDAAGPKPTATPTSTPTPTPTSTPTPTPTPGPVGGLAELPGTAGTPLETPDSSGPGVGVPVGAIATIAAVGAVALGGAAWYARKRRGS